MAYIVFDVVLRESGRGGGGWFWCLSPGTLSYMTEVPGVGPVVYLKRL